METIIPQTKVPVRSLFTSKEYKGELYTHAGDFVGNVYLKNGKGYVVLVQYGMIEGSLGPFDPKDFEKAGTLRLSQAQSVQKWRFKNENV